MAAEYAALAGNRKVEFLDLTWPQVDRKAGHIRVKRGKQRGKKRGEVIEQIEITTPLAALLDRLEALRGDKECLYVFTTRYGTHYTRRLQGLLGEVDGRGDRRKGDRAALHVPRLARVLRHAAQA